MGHFEMGKHFYTIFKRAIKQLEINYLKFQKNSKWTLNIYNKMVKNTE